MFIGLIGTAAALVATLTLIGEGRTHVQRRLRRRQLRDPVQDLLPVGRDPGAGHLVPVLPRGRLLPGGVLLPAAHVVPRLHHDAVVARHAAAVHRARAGVRSRVPHGGVPQERSQVERGRPEVLPDRRPVHRRDALRHEPDLRAHGRDAAGRDRAGPVEHRRREGDAGVLRDPVRGHRVRVQGLGGAVPVLGARHVRGRAGPGGGVPGGRVQRGRVRRAAAADVRGRSSTSTRSGRRSSPSCRSRR